MRGMWRWGVVLFALASCDDRAKANPTEVVASAEPSPPSATASASALPSPPTGPPHLVLHPVDPLKPHPKGETTDYGLHTIDGAVLLTNQDRLFHWADDGAVSEVGKLPAHVYPHIGGRIFRVEGHWPDRIDLFAASLSNRSIDAVFYPLKGGGGAVDVGRHLGLSWIAGEAHIGETTVVMTYTMSEGHELVKVRGPFVKPALRQAESEGCAKAEVWDSNLALKTRAFGATRAGTALHLGHHCKGKGPALEAWPDPKKPSKLTSLVEHWPNYLEGSSRMLPGPDDRMYLVLPRYPVLVYEGGEVKALPKVPGGRKDLFVSPTGALFAVTRDQLFILEDDAWTPRATFDWPLERMTLALRGDRFVARSGEGFFELRPGPRATLDPDAPTPCDTPFVYLADVRADRTPEHPFPTTARQLARLEARDGVKLVDFHYGGVRRLGATAPDVKTAVAAFHHFEEEKPDDDVRLLCFAPHEPREVPVPAAKGGTSP